MDVPFYFYYKNNSNHSNTNTHLRLALAVLSSLSCSIAHQIVLQPLYHLPFLLIESGLCVALLATQIIDLIVLFIPTMIGELILALPIIGQLLCIAIRYYNGFYTEPDGTANNTGDPSFYEPTTLL